MSKKIIILNGSPRPNGNTAALIDEFTKGAESAGNTVTRFNLKGMDIRPCIGCFKGGSDPASPCVQKDDMNKIYPAYKEADIVVFASPMYYWSWTGLIKTAFERLFAIEELYQGERPQKGTILLMPAGVEQEAEDWKTVTDYYQALLNHLGWTDCGMVKAGGVMDIGDIKGKSSLKEAYALGASIS